MQGFVHDPYANNLVWSFISKKDDALSLSLSLTKLMHFEVESRTRQFR